MIVSRVYPKLAEYVRVKKIDVGPGVVEVYHIMANSPFVEILAPMQNFGDFIFQ